MADGYDRYEVRRGSWLFVEPDGDVQAVDIGAVVAGLVAYAKAVLRKYGRSSGR